jgi:xanthine dehydrogenase accessory factor
MKNIYLEIANLQPSDSRLVLATVVKTVGSTPQKAGSSALFNERGLVSGTVGGGIVEGKVEKLAIEATRSKRSGLYHFNLANDISNKEEAICGGQISILTDASPVNSASVFEKLRQSMEKGTPGVLITWVSGSDETTIVINRFWMDESAAPSLPSQLLEMIGPEMKKLIREKNPQAFSELEIGMKGEERVSRVFLQPLFPPDQLIIAGAGHIGRALAHLGNLLDFEVTIIDDRREFANRENIPDADHLVVNDIGEAMQELQTGDNKYVVIVTRGHKDDAAALRPCFGKELAYIGMIGSKNKIAAMRRDFIENSWAAPGQWDLIHAPVGLAIKSQTVEEIAISIAAELILVRNNKR